ncbi:restriction endonuclease subunit S [Lactobacillus iners]|uniref:restriction endonuclease subunit S n=1 Tax=Lactobacillus iners TaxID=147802 RepID=UPI0023514A37|nr:restriction endonuclease subunit S [Lactobacillus iners]
MTKWLEKTLGEVTSFMKKGIPPKYTVEESEKTIRVLNQKCNRNFEISYSESRLHDCEKKIVPADKMLRAGDVLINSTGIGTAGRVAQVVEVKGPTTIDGHMILLRPSEELNPIYYGYAVKAFQSQIEGLAEGSTGQTEINRMRLQDEVIIKYPKDKLVQENIGRFLSNIDDKIKTNTEINKNLEEQVSVLYQSWFEDFEITNGVCPENWSYQELSTIADIASGKRPPVKSDNCNEKTPISIVGAASVMGFTSEANHTDKILVTGRVGTHGVVQRFNTPCWTSDNTLVITSPYYEFTNQILHRIDYSAMNRGSTQPLITQGDMKKVVVLVPDENTLAKFEEFAGSLMLKWEANNKENVKLASLRDTLLPKLMSGELDASNLDL